MACRSYLSVHGVTLPDSLCWSTAGKHACPECLFWSNDGPMCVYFSYLGSLKDRICLKSLCKAEKKLYVLIEDELKLYPSWPLSSGDIPDTPPVVAPVGGGTEAVHSCHHDGWGSQIRRSHLHWARKPDAGEGAALVLMTNEGCLSAWRALTASVLFATAPRRGRGGPTRAEHGLSGCHSQEVPSVGEGCVLVLCPDVCATRDLDLQPRFWHHQHLLGVMEGLWAEEERKARRLS